MRWLREFRSKHCDFNRSPEVMISSFLDKITYFMHGRLASNFPIQRSQLIHVDILVVIDKICKEI